MTSTFWWPGAQVAGDVALRLVAALILGGVVAWIYRRSRHEPASSFTVTLVLLAVLIAMVTQVIGDNIARAFSLVGALSIVRFRTVVRDTQDTAYVIFAVAVGMAVGASSLWLAVAGIAVIGAAAMFMRTAVRETTTMTHRLTVRVTIGRDIEQTIAPALEGFVAVKRLTAVSTARQGAAVEATYRAALRRGRSAADLVAALNRLEGVQNVEITLLDEGSEAPVDDD